MQFKYTETRAGQIVDSALIADLDSFADDFKAGILVEVKVCLENYNHEVAKKLIDFHRIVLDAPVSATIGMRLVHEYDKRTGLTGVWEIVA
jgi:hypothetical protein